MKLEQCYKPKELAAMVGVSADTIRRMFKYESGVLMIGHGETRTQRSYHMMRIPKSVAERVLGKTERYK